MTQIPTPPNPYEQRHVHPPQGPSQQRTRTAAAPASPRRRCLSSDRAPWGPGPRTSTGRPFLFRGRHSAPRRGRESRGGRGYVCPGNCASMTGKSGPQGFRQTTRSDETWRDDTPIPPTPRPRADLAEGPGGRGALLGVVALAMVWLWPESSGSPAGDQSTRQVNGVIEAIARQPCSRTLRRRRRRRARPVLRHCPGTAHQATRRVRR